MPVGNNSINLVMQDKQQRKFIESSCENYTIDDKSEIIEQLAVRPFGYQEQLRPEKLEIKLESKRNIKNPYLLRIQAISGDTLKNAIDIRWRAHKLIGPKVVLRVANEFDERDENAPRMRLQKDQPFHKNTCNLLLNVTM